MAESPIIREQAIFESRTYRFVFNNRWGWAHFTICDVTFELLMTSDYGNYAHRWPPHFGGQTLTEFLATKGRGQYDCDYIVNKLASSTRSRELEDEVDCEQTEGELKRVICERRRARAISADLAREAWDDLIGEWVAEECNAHALPKRLYEAVNEEIWHCVRMCKSGWYLMLRDEILPFFCRWLRENVVSKGAPEAAHV
jgi:hypothetical protein